LENATLLSYQDKKRASVSMEKQLKKIDKQIRFKMHVFHNNIVVQTNIIQVYIKLNPGIFIHYSNLPLH
jgi:uncharacterized membrane protein